ncbi:MAG: hypothetical protein OXH71_04210 [Candidatus Dadabacteria bacterium]|nr:hypothetical protein [Candidatus Dadabacteria bacterium]MDE0519881.1 hypothetical protein [Candidatus Dadabacteria bacterium]
MSCTPSAEDFVSDLFDDYEYEDEEEYYECSLGDASLPFGTHPEELITPEGYEWECTGGGANSIRFDSDGTFSVALSTVAYSVALDYFSDCSGYPSREETGEWIVDVRGRLCIKLDNIQPGLYNCQRLAYGSGTVRGSTCVDYYENGDYLGQECDRDNRLGTCTLVEE